MLFNTIILTEEEVAELESVTFAELEAQLLGEMK